MAISFATMTSSSVETLIAQRHHLGERRALDELVGDRAARRVEDQVDERAVLVPRLVEPALRRALGLPARGLERVERACRRPRAGAGSRRRARSLGPPRAHAERPPPSTNGISALCRIPAAAFIASISSSKEGSGTTRAFPFCPIAATSRGVIRIAAAGDLHASEATPSASSARSRRRGRGGRRSCSRAT